MYSSTVYSLTEGGGLGAGEVGCFLAFFCVCVCVCVCGVCACMHSRKIEVHAERKKAQTHCLCRWSG